MSSPQTHKLIWLELLRFIAAIAVVIWHYQHFAYVGLSGQALVRSEQPFYRSLSVFYEHGHYAVQMFWAISGYIFFHNYRHQIVNGAISAKTFVIRRFSRLYPLHLATLLIVAGLQYLYLAKTGSYFVYPHNDWSHFGLQLAFASNWSPSFGYSFNAPIWSVSIEVLVYALFFMALRVSSALWMSLLIMGLTALGMVYFLQWLVFECVLLFYVGGLAAMATPRIESSSFRWSRTFPWLLLLLAGRVVSARWHGSPTSVWLEAPVLLVGVFALLVIFGRAGNLRSHSGLTRVLTLLGNLTYSSYLLHFPLQLVIALVFAANGEHIPYRSQWLFAVFLCITFGLAYLAYRYFESPMQSILRRVMSGRTDR